MDLESQQFLPPKCDHTKLQNQIRIVTANQDEARLVPTASGRDEDLWRELAVMTRHTRQSGKEFLGLRMQ